MSTITIELCAEDRARLDKIIDALAAGRPDCTRCAQQVVDYVTQVTGCDEYGKRVEPEHPVENPFPEPVKEAAPAAAPAPAPAPVQPEAPAVSMSDAQQKVVALSAAGKKNEVRAIIKTYAERVSAIPEDKLTEVWDKLVALEG